MSDKITDADVLHWADNLIHDEVSISTDGVTICMYDAGFLAPNIPLMEWSLVTGEEKVDA